MDPRPENMEQSDPLGTSAKDLTYGSSEQQESSLEDAKRPEEQQVEENHNDEASNEADSSDDSQQNERTSFEQYGHGVEDHPESETVLTPSGQETNTPVEQTMDQDLLLSETRNTAAADGMGTMEPEATEQSKETDSLHESHEAPKRSFEKLSRNQHGVYVFLGLAVSFSLISLLVSLGAARHRIYLLAIGILSCLLIVVDLVVCVYFSGIFIQRSLHAALSLALSVASAFVMFSVSEMKAWLGMASFMQFLAACLHYWVPIDSPAARLFLLPWISLEPEGVNAISVTTGAEKAADQTEDFKGPPLEQTRVQDELNKHTRQIRHRTLSVFHDWPAPIPFPATTLYSFRTNSASELPFSKGDELTVLDCRGNWWQARHPVTGVIGFVPSNFLAVRQKGRISRDVEAGGSDELSVQTGQAVEVLEVHEAACLCRGVNGKIGSVPFDAVALIP